jgi:pilus assembly protein CpaC
MQSKNIFLKRSLALLASVSAIAGATVADAAPRKTFKRTSVSAATSRPVGVQRPAGETTLSQGRGQLINLPTAITDIFVSNDQVADVQVKSPFQLYIFGKSKGETSVYATNKAGAVVFSTNVRVGQNLNSLDQVMKASFPDSDITAYSMGQTVVLAGTVSSPDEALQAQRIAAGLVNPGVNVSDPNAMLDVVVINRLKYATPLQVSLQVRIAEVRRDFGKNIGVDWSANNNGPTNTGTTFSASNVAGAGTVRLGGRLLGLNVLSQLDLGETEGFVTTLASPTLTSLSGQPAEFLVGGEIPLPFVTTTNNSTTTSITFRPYGIKLLFTPTVAADGRITLKVAPEVSELDYSSSILLQGSTTRIPGTTTRRVDTTVELGSGQSFVIGGLLRAGTSNTVSKLPGAGDVPILGSLFRSTNFKRDESELMIVVTPYLVKPVSANQIVLPTDGYKTPRELGRIFNGELYNGATEKRPVPTLGAPQTVVKPSVGASLSPKSSPAAAAPGFSN